MRKAIATIAIGDECQDMWKRWFKPSWDRYAERHGYDIVAFCEPIREDPRPPTWQKLVIMDELEGKYDRVLFIDTDVVITDHAPCVVDSMGDSDGLGVVSWAGSHGGDRTLYDCGFRRSWAGCPLEWVSAIKTFGDMYATANQPDTGDHIIAGMFVATPDHKDILEAVYACDPDGEYPGGDAIPFGSVLGTGYADRLHHLDKRHQCVWYMHALMHYPFVLDPSCHGSVVNACLRATAANNYMIHFCNGVSRPHAQYLQESA